MVNSLIVLLALFGSLYSVVGDNIPVLLWSSSASMADLPHILPGKNLDNYVFNQYLTKISHQTDNVVVFAQDRLNMRDFTQYADVYNPQSDGGSFRNIKQLMKDHFSAQLPSVASPMDSVNKLANGNDKRVITVTKPSDIQAIKPRKGGNLIIVKLIPISGKVDNRKIFADNDRLIGDVTGELEKQGIQYAAVFTAESSQIDNMDEIRPSVRHLLSADNSNGTFINVTGCMFLNMLDTTITITKGKLTFDTELVKPEDTGSECGNDTALLKLKYQNDTLTVDLELAVILEKGGDWQVINATVDLDGKVKNVSFSNDKIEFPEFSVVSAPRNFSYHCSLLSIKAHQNKSDPSGDFVTLTFKEFQLQAFDIKNEQFSQPWDCVAFFTPGIWMGITVTLFLVAILFFGMTMLANINTQDRFDDPKGKTITVNVSE